VLYKVEEAGIILPLEAVMARRRVEEESYLDADEGSSIEEFEVLDSTLAVSGLGEIDDEAFYAVTDEFDEDFEDEELELEGGDDLDDRAQDDLVSNDTVGLYIKEATRVPLLTAEEEIALAQRIEAGEAAKKSTEGMNSREYQVVIQDGALAREHLTKANTRLVVSVAKKHIGRGVPFLDLIQEGNIGLMRAVSKYDWRRGFRFSTYATNWIRQAVSRAIMDQADTIRVPVHTQEKLNDIHDQEKVLAQELGRDPSLDELTMRYCFPGLNENQVDTNEFQKKRAWLERLLLTTQETVSTEKLVPDVEGDDLSYEEAVEDEDDRLRPEAATDRTLLREHIREAFSLLSEIQIFVLEHRYGLKGGVIYTLDEVALLMPLRLTKTGERLTRERIRQIEQKALRTIQESRSNPVLAQNLADFLPSKR
jgi:RNA polymerase primary sigma factor